MNQVTPGQRERDTTQRIHTDDGYWLKGFGKHRLQLQRIKVYYIESLFYNRNNNNNNRRLLYYLDNEYDLTNNTWVSIILKTTILRTKNFDQLYKIYILNITKIAV